MSLGAKRLSDVETADILSPDGDRLPSGLWCDVLVERVEPAGRLARDAWRRAWAVAAGRRSEQRAETPPDQPRPSTPRIA